MCITMDIIMLNVFITICNTCPGFLFLRKFPGFLLPESLYLPILSKIMRFVKYFRFINLHTGLICLYCAYFNSLLSDSLYLLNIS